MGGNSVITAAVSLVLRAGAYNMRREPQHQQPTTRARGDRQHPRRCRLRFRSDHGHEQRDRRPGARVRAVPAQSRRAELPRPQSRRPLAEHPVDDRYRHARVSGRATRMRQRDARRRRLRNDVRKLDASAARRRAVHTQSRPSELPRPNDLATATSAAEQPHWQRRGRARGLPGVSAFLAGAHTRCGSVWAPASLSRSQLRPRAISIRRPRMRSPSTRSPLCWYSLVIQVLIPRICAAVSSEKVRSTYMSST